MVAVAVGMAAAGAVAMVLVVAVAVAVAVAGWLGAKVRGTPSVSKPLHLGWTPSSGWSADQWYSRYR